MNQVVITSMTETDLDKIKDSLSSNFDDFWNYNIIKSELNNPVSKYIVAKLHEEIVGFAGIIDTVDQMEITNIVVRIDLRNRGIGDMLLKELINLSKEKSSIFLEVNSKNEYAIKLYEKNGFKKCGLRKKYYKQTDDAIIMKLLLNQ